MLFHLHDGASVLRIADTTMSVENSSRFGRLFHGASQFMTKAYAVAFISGPMSTTMRLRISLLAFLLLGLFVYLHGEEQVIIRGTLRDGATREPLVFATVTVSGTQLGTTTNGKGDFVLTVPKGQYSLHCSFVGYRTQDVVLDAQHAMHLDIALSATDVLLQDVTVYAYRESAGDMIQENALTLQSEKIKTTTAVIADVLRSVQLLPGVSTNNEFSAKFNVRGGNQDENLVLVNGTQVYDPYHVKEVPNASIGIMNMEMIRKMDLLTGGFPARYGDKMSSVVDIEYREGDREKASGSASLSITDADLVAEGPLGENGSFILGARKSYLECIIKMLDYGSYVHPAFYDVQGVVAYSLAPGQKLLCKFIHAGDSFSEDPTTHVNSPYQWRSSDGLTNTQQTGDSTDNHSQYYSSLFALQSINILSSSTLVKTEFSFYDQREEERYWTQYYYHYTGVRPGQVYFYNSLGEQQYHNTLQIRTMEFNSVVDHQLSPLYGIKAGVVYQNIRYYEDQTFQRTIYLWHNTDNYPDTTRAQQIENPMDWVNNQMNTRSFKAAAFVENTFQFTESAIANIGGRMDYFDLDKEMTVSPRIQLAYRLSPGLTVRGAWGHYYQSPNYRQITYAVASDTNARSQRAIHYTAGFDYTAHIGKDLEKFCKVKLEGFYKKYDQLMNAVQTSDGFLYYSRRNDAVGFAKGFDFYLMYSAPDVSGWVSYGYLIAEQDILNDTYGWHPRYSDQRHTLSATGTWEPGREWSLNLRFVYGSGYPFTPSTAIYDPTRKTWIWISGAPNSERLPSYSRTDFRATKNFSLFGFSTSVFLDVSNIFNVKNLQSYRYSFDGNGMPLRKDQYLWPIIPSIGMSVRM